MRRVYSVARRSPNSIYGDTDPEKETPAIAADAER